MPVYYREKESGKIVAKFVGCDTRSKVFRDSSRYQRFVSLKDLPVEVKPTKVKVGLVGRVKRLFGR